MAKDYDPVVVNALTDLYNVLNGPKWYHKDNWLSEKSPCTWFGVKCNE